jgi:hypothetical protein
VPDSGLYPPKFVSQSGVVRVILLSPEVSDPMLAAEGLRTTFESNPLTIKGSLCEETFITDSALRGMHVRFRQRTQQDGRVTETDCHQYFVRNQCGRCVVVCYQPGTCGDAGDVDQRIRNSLRWQ